VKSVVYTSSSEARGDAAWGADAMHERETGMGADAIQMQCTRDGNRGRCRLEGKRGCAMHTREGGRGGDAPDWGSMDAI
jgi:hypothetical protein